MSSRNGQSGALNSIKNWYATSKQEAGLYIALVILVVFLAIASPAFLKPDNLINIIRQVSIVGIIAIGGFIVILTGGMDISVGTVAALTGIVVAKLSIHMQVPMPLAIAAGMCVGLLAGLLNGTLSTYLKLPSFIVTLGTMQVCQGLGYVITQATPISNFPPEFVELGRGHLGAIPWPVIILAGLYIFMSFFMKYSKFGTYCYALGGNKESARISGIRVNRIQVTVYILGGLFSSLGGLIVAARTNAGSAQVGSTYLFDVFTACVLGGTALSGGIGRLPGVIVGCVFVGILNNGLVQLNVDSFYQMVVQGVVLIIAVVLQSLMTREKRIKEKK